MQPVAQPIDRKARAAEARAAGVSHETLRRIRQLPPEQRESIAAGEVSLADVRRDHRLAERAERNATLVGRNAELPPEQRRYAVIYADPPWQYEHAVSNSRAVENHYPTMDLEAICALPVARLSAVDAVLFMWATSPKVAEACRVVDAWGFRYVTCAVWDKGRIEMGYYFRQQHELLFVATRGNPGTPAPGDRTSSVLSYPRRRHSEKPTEVYELLERMYPDVARIELFARAKRPGWERWGNQA